MGYATALAMAKEKLKTFDIEKACEAMGAVMQNGEILIPWFGENRPVNSGSETEQVLWLHYLISGVHTPLTGKWIAFRELPSAMFYEPKFMQRAEGPLIKRFGENPAQMEQIGLGLGGKTAQYGDAAVILNLLPRVPVLYIIWGKDSELSPECRVLFDSSASRFLPTEDLAVLASLGAYKLIQIAVK
ncbi:MAG: DUF3786 domain-containing protein [Oscillospiraceae bacterium]|jgi:hypothetical protein|nr:DUF3786 domain-containing protein [Oscillospiraceae bacterium]